MLYSFIKIFSNILADKEIPIPSIDLQPIFIVPHEITTTKHDMNRCLYADKFYSLYFSVDYHFDETTNTLETIKQNFDFSEDPKIVLKRFVKKSTSSDLKNIATPPKEISLPTTTISKGLYRLFIASGPCDGQSKNVNINVGCQMILLYMDHINIEEILNNPNIPLKEIPNLFEIDEERDFIKYSFQFFVTIKKSSYDMNEDPYITISTDMFRIDTGGDFTTIKSLKVNKDEYYIEEDQPGSEDKEIKERSENAVFEKIKEKESSLEDNKVEKCLESKLSINEQKNEEHVSHGLLPNVNDGLDAENTNPQTDPILC